MNQLKMHTPDFTQEKIAQIRELFPTCVTEAKDEDTGEVRLAIDFDQLRQELSDQIVEGPQERYRLDWPGKREAILAANAPIAKTLRPARDESVDFDTTQNLFIEGDNLDALKLLQETYLGKVKMIYIDPPYNTGKDFIYNDNFAESRQEYLERSNQLGEDGRLVSNTDSNGRFHSDWLSMMYPRLRLARNLLREDGVIFISIDDNEVAQLRKICDEVFGESNFEGHIHWRRRHNQPNDKNKLIGLVAEHILVYSRSSHQLKAAGVGKLPLTGKFSNPDNDPKGNWASKPWRVGSGQSGSKYSITTPAGQILEGEWMGEESTYLSLLKDNRIYFPRNGKGAPRKKYYQFEREKEGQCATNWWSHKHFGHNQDGSREVSELFNNIKGLFSNPKNITLLKHIIMLANLNTNDIVLDFFAGSSTTAHAVMKLNAEDGGNRRFIMVQLPEETDEKSEAYKAGYKNIAELSKERIRRAGKQILEGEYHEDWDQDVGFRVLKVDSSNMKDVYYRPGELSQEELFKAVDNIKEDRTNEDLLFQVLVDWGVDLRLPIRREQLQEKEVFIIDDNTLIACFDKGITEDLIKELAALKPLRVVFRDSGFSTDAVKINAMQIFKQVSPDTDMKTL